MAIARDNPYYALPKLVGVCAALYFILHGLYLFSQIENDSVGRDSLLFLICIQLLPFFICLTQMRFNYLAFILLNHFFTYSMAKYNSVFNVLGLSVIPYASRIAIRELTHATFLIVLGYLTVSAFSWLKIEANKRAEIITLRLPNRQLLIMGTVVLTGSFVGPYLPGAVKQLHDLACVMCLILLLSSGASQSKRLHQFLVIGAIFNMSHTLVQHGSLVDFGHFAVILFVRSCVRRDLKGVSGVLFIVLMGLFIQPIKGMYRLQSRAEDFSFFEKMGVLTDLISWRYFTEEGRASHNMVLDADGRFVESNEEDDGYLKEGEGDALSALSLGFARVHDDSLERTLTMTPSMVPFWEGETYSNMLFMFIPRVLWPDKPGWKHWHKFGKSYGYLAPNDETTSVSFSMFAEAYMNFGFEGLYIISLLFGGFIAVTERMAFSLFKGAYVFAFVSLLTPIMNYSADLGIMVNRLIIVISALLIFRPFLIRNVIGDDYSR